jgi:hypothetical protein
MGTRACCRLCGGRTRTEACLCGGCGLGCCCQWGVVVAVKMVRPEGFEPPTLWFVAKCSIQLSYGRTVLHGNEISLLRMREQSKRGCVCGAPGRIRTSDPLVRSQMLYPAELRARDAEGDDLWIR